LFTGLHRKTQDKLLGR